MVVNWTTSIQLDDLHASIPLHRTRSPSLPTKSSPDRSYSKRRPRRQKLIVERPAFVNFASTFINPYRSLTPISHTHRGRARRKTSKSSRRKPNKQKHVEDPISDEENQSISLILSNDPIDLWPSNSKALNMDITRQRQIAIDDSVSREVIEAWQAVSLNQLVTLMRDFAVDKNQIDCLWMVYYWIAQNIHYDVDADLDKERQSPTPEDIFQSMTTTSEGYAAMFKFLCDCLDIRCVEIAGHVKDQNYRIDQLTFAGVNHTWNAVQLDNAYWYLIDSAWGSGHTDDNHEYVKDLQAHYFLARPEHLIYDHRPEEPRWQLLAKPISMLEYVRLPCVHSSYFTHELTLISPRFSSVVVIDAKQCLAEVLIQAPNDVQLTCALEEPLDGTSLTQYDASRQVWQCLFAPQQKGFHTLLMFVNRSSPPYVFTQSIELGMDVLSRDLSLIKPLPTTYEKFIEHRCQILSPLNGILRRGTEVTIRCRLPHAVCARISLDGYWLDEVPLKNHLFKQKIHVPEHEVIVYAQFLTKQMINVYDGLIRYGVEHL